MKTVWGLLGITVMWTCPGQAEESGEPRDLENARFRYEIELVELNQNYTRHLESLRDRYIEAGRLEDANAVELEIKRIVKLTPLKQPIPMSDEELAEYLSGTRWQMEGDKVLTIQATGEVHKSWGVLRPKWKVEGMRFLYEGKVFKFSNDFEEMTLLSGKNDAGKKGTLIEQ